MFCRADCSSIYLYDTADWGLPRLYLTWYHLVRGRSQPCLVLSKTITNQSHFSCSRYKQKLTSKTTITWDLCEIGGKRPDLVHRTSHTSRVVFCCSLVPKCLLHRILYSPFSDYVIKVWTWPFFPTKIWCNPQSHFKVGQTRPTSEVVGQTWKKNIWKPTWNEPERGPKM